MNLYSFILIKSKSFLFDKKSWLSWVFFEIQTNNHQFIILIRSHIWTRCVDFRHIHCIVHLHIETRERTTADVVRTYKLPSCFLFSCLPYSSLFVSFSFTTPSVCVYAKERHYSHNYSLLSTLFFFIYWRRRKRERVRKDVGHKFCNKRWHVNTVKSKC